MAAGEETLRDIEKKAAGEVASLFGDKSRKIAILAETFLYGSTNPTTAIENKFLPVVQQVFEMLGLEQSEEGYWKSPTNRRIFWPKHALLGLDVGSTIEKYAEDSTASLLNRLFRVQDPKGRWIEAEGEKPVAPAIKEQVKQFYKLLGADLKKQFETQGQTRDPTFVDEAEWFKRYMSGEKMLYKHPNTGEVTKVQLPREKWAEVETFPYYGEEELRQRGQEIAEEYEGETVSLGIFGHAGRMFGGVGVEKPAWQEAFQDVDIDTAFIGACSMTNRPEVCKVMSGSLSKEEKEAVVVLATDMAWGTSPGYNPEEPSVKVAFQKGAGIKAFEASPELREEVQMGDYKFPGTRRGHIGEFFHRIRENRIREGEERRAQELTTYTTEGPCAGMTGNELSDCEAGHMLYNLFQGVAGIFRQRQAPTDIGGIPAGSPGRMY